MENNQERVFWCKHSNVRVLTSVLSTLLDKQCEVQHAVVTINKSCLRFTVEQSGSSQANVYLSSDLFQEFHVPCISCESTGARSSSSSSEDGGNNELVFGIVFSLFMESLSLCSESLTAYTGVELAWGGVGHPLVLVLAGSGLRTQCVHRTMAHESVESVQCRTDQVVGEVIAGTEILREAFGEVDWSASHIVIDFTPEAPFFRVSSVGDVGSCHVEYPKGAQLFDKFFCEKEIKFCYRTSVMKPMVKGFSIAQRTQIRVFEGGVMKVQHMVQTEGKQMVMIDFCVNAEEVQIDGKTD